eukprot:5080975-Pleurochrysis_carterae.AAC.2
MTASVITIALTMRELTPRGQNHVRAGGVRRRRRSIHDVQHRHCSKVQQEQVEQVETEALTALKRRRGRRRALVSSCWHHEHGNGAAAHSSGCSLEPRQRAQRPRMQ